jgi:hypothetical protein
MKPIQSWKDLDGCSYFFHDDNALRRLLVQHYSTFSGLADVVNYCIVSGTTFSDLWRYIVLWEFGGIYADIDSSSMTFNHTTLQNDDDAYFVVEQYHCMSQYFMAASPRHPIMFYAATIAIHNLLHAPDIGLVDTALVTGPHALHAALRQFVQDVGGSRVEPLEGGRKPVQAGVYVGTHNRTLRVDGQGDDPNRIVFRDRVQLRYKRRDYKFMGMAHYHDTMTNATGISCQAAIHKLIPT